MTMFNFSAGPAMMPPSVLVQAAAEMTDWHGSGMGVMEMSHRGPEFMAIYAQAQADLRELLQVPAHFKILFMQGGGLAENAIVPLNLMGLKGAGHRTPHNQPLASQPAASADFVITGSWSEKAYTEAQRYGQAQIAASSKATGFHSIPDPATWQLNPDASYVHLCSNETIHGTEFSTLPDLQALGSKAALVVDFSSQVASCAMDWSRIGLAFGGAQKNLGPAGLTVVVVREDLLGHALPVCPSAFNYQTVADNDSMYNTPPTYAIYMAGLVFQWLKKQGGIAAMAQQNSAKAALLYAAIDGSDLYFNPVDKACRSRMNVPFFLRNENLNAAFLAGAHSAGLLQLRGHKSVGGMRASLYNAMPLAGVQALVGYLKEFERTHG
jgi:phosphoserine aminotransferase